MVHSDRTVVVLLHKQSLFQTDGTECYVNTSHLDT